MSTVIHVYLENISKLNNHYKLSIYGISGRVVAIMKHFPSGRSLKVVVNCQVCEAHEINAGILHGQISVYTNELTKNIPRLLVNIYADDTAVYRCTSKNLNN